MRKENLRQLLQRIAVPGFRNHRKPLSVVKIDDMVMLCILRAVVTDGGVARNGVVLVNDGIADSAVLADINIIQQNAVVNSRIAVNKN